MDVFFDRRWWLIGKYNTIWGKVSADIKKNLIASLSMVKKNLKNKLKSHGNEVTEFYNLEIPKAESDHFCLAVIRLDSALKKDENYYPQFKKRV